MNLDKILIIGVSGSGKTTFARKIFDFLKIPLVHYDTLVWKENWKEEEEKIVAQKLNTLAHQDRWIIEGYINPSAKVKLARADIVLYLDCSGFQAALGGIKRWWQYRGRTRPEMANGCIEKFDWNFLKVMWKREERPEIEDAIEEFEEKVIRLKTNREKNAFLSKLFQGKFF